MDKGLGKDIRLSTVPVYRRRRQELPPLRLSPTSILAFRQCRQRYKFLYIDKLGDQYGQPRPYFTMANHVHATLRDFFSLHPVQRRTPAAIQQLLQRNWRRYRVGFRDEDDEARWARKAEVQLKAFVDNYDVSVRPVTMEEAMQTEISPGVILRGRVDRIDREADGSLHIIDYKTGNVPQEMDWTQLELHALIVSRCLPWPVSRVSYLYLGPALMQSTGMAADDLHQVHWGTLSTARTIRGEREFNPEPGRWCGQCDFISICPRGEEAQPLAADSGQLELWNDLSDQWEGGS